MSALEVDATVVIAIVATVGLIAACIGWFFRRGADERELAVAIRDNTSATRDLSTDFKAFKDSTVEVLHSHDLRLTRLEVSPPPVHVTTKIEASDVSAPTYRNAGPQG